MLSNIYINLLNEIVWSFSVECHQCSVDIQLCVSLLKSPYMSVLALNQGFEKLNSDEVSEDHALRTIVFELLTRHNLNSRFKIPTVYLMTLLDALEAGYGKYKNPYHNQIHAADVTQTVHCFLLRTGMVHCLTEIEILAIIFAAAIHDYEHTGTTNSFHIQTKSDTAILYNDRSVLENHHISAVFRMMQDDEMNVLVNLNKDEFMELRSLVIEMVLATDMSCHFQQVKSMKTSLQQLERTDKEAKLFFLAAALQPTSIPHQSSGQYISTMDPTGTPWKSSSDRIGK
uniref:Calcium/calmodulin-dependent 3',5'-cyclic nucleotide phosphodiesterase 1B n=1 Tax=Sphaerodactylus townsendi TaxID=933632 RepID=A0ACB8EP25_9SAUR